MGLTAAIALFTIREGQPIALKFDWPLFVETISYGIRAHIVTFAGFIGIRSSILVIRTYGDITDVGYWSIASQISDAMQVVPSVVATVLFPRLIRANKDDRWSQTVKAAAGLAALMLVGCTCFAIVSYPLIVLLFGAQISAVNPNPTRHTSRRCLSGGHDISFAISLSARHSDWSDCGVGRNRLRSNPL